MNYLTSSKYNFAEKVAISLGIMLFIAFLSPLIIPGKDFIDELFFLNIELLGEVSIPFTIVILLPAITAILIFIFLFDKKINPYIYLFGGLLPFLTLLLDPELSLFLGNLISIGNPKDTGISINVILGGLANLCILTGVFSLYVQPEIKTGKIIAYIGATFLALNLIIPFHGDLLLLEPIRMFQMKDPSESGINTVYGITKIIQLALVLGIIVTAYNIKEPHSNQQRSRKIMSYWMWNIVISVVPMFYALFIVSDTNPASSASSMLITGLIKFGSWMLGTYLLIPLGISLILIAKERKLEEENIFIPADPEVEKELDKLYFELTNNKITEKDYHLKRSKILEKYK